MVWGWFVDNLTGRLHCIEKSMNGAMYYKILNKNLLPLARTLKRHMEQ